MTRPTIHLATSNKEKIANAEHVCGIAGIPLEIVALEIDEIQGEDSEQIAIAKAKAAFEAYGQPVMVSDDSWSIPALNGFPGPYMKSMNTWFAPNDFLQLLNGVSDRRAELHQYLAYCDGTNVAVFHEVIHGTVLETSYGDSTKAPWMNVVSMDGDNGKSLAEVFNGSEESIRARYLKRPEVWSHVVTWYKNTYEN